VKLSQRERHCEEQGKREGEINVKRKRGKKKNGNVRDRLERVRQARIR